jgi:DNA polymerase-3 subunit delta'
MGFDSFIGNPKVVLTVREILAAGRVPGAFLFSGPEGVGKKTLALMMAKALACERRSDDFCGECARCRKADEMLAAGRDDLARRREIKDSARRVEGLIYFDLQLIEPITRFILTEQIRLLRNVAYTRPFEFPRRIFIIDQAQTIHWQAVDLLLKVLEEPPETTTFIVVCPNAYELRATIRSRCRLVPFQAVDESLILALLAKERQLTKPQQALAARVAAGSIAAAKAFDPAAYERRRKPWMDFLQAIAQRDPTGSSSPDWRLLFDAAKSLTEDREDFEANLRIGYSLLRDLLQVLEKGSEAEVTSIDLLPRLKAMASKLGLSEIEKLKSGLDQAYRLQIRNVNQQLGFETLGADLLSSAQASSRQPAVKS